MSSGIPMPVGIEINFSKEFSCTKVKSWATTQTKKESEALVTRQERMREKIEKKFEDREQGNKTEDTLGSGEFQIPQWEFRGQSPLAGRRSAEDRPYIIKKYLDFMVRKFRWGGLRQRWTRTRHKKETRTFLPCYLEGFGRKVLGFACFLRRTLKSVS